MEWKTILTTTHIIGTVLGVGGATFAELFVRKSLDDGVVDPTESAFLRLTYRVLRIGLILLVISGFGYLLQYRLEGHADWLNNEKLWAKLTVVVVLLVNAILLEVRKIPLWLGSAISITSWYMALFLGVWRNFTISYFETFGIYLGAVVVVVAFFQCLRNSAPAVGAGRRAKR